MNLSMNKNINLLSLTSIIGVFFSNIWVYGNDKSDQRNPFIYPVEINEDNDYPPSSPEWLTRVTAEKKW
jgi:hypothetical protein